MISKLRTWVFVGIVATLGLGGLAGPALAGDIPIDAPEDCVEMVMDLPALPICKDAQGRHIMDLPAIGELREPAPAASPVPAPSSKKLPKTGMHVEDFAAVGLAALAGGAVLLRRLRLAVA